MRHQREQNRYGEIRPVENHDRKALSYCYQVEEKVYAFFFEYEKDQYQLSLTGWDVTALDINQTMLIKTHWGRVTHICGGNLTIIGSDNGLSPGRRQAIF